MATYKVEIDGGIETVTARTEKEAIRKAARKQGNSKSVGKSFGPKVKVTKIKEEAQMKSFSDIREAVNAAQQAAIAIAKKEKVEESKVLDNMSQLPKGMERPLKSMQQVKKDADLGGMKITHIVKNKQGTKVVAAVVSNGKKNFVYVNNKGVAPLKEGKQTHMFDNEKDARAKAKEIGGKYVKGTGKSAGKHAAIKEGAFTKKAVETGKVKTGPSKDRMAAMQKQDDNRPTLRKNEGKKMDSAAMKKAMDAFKKRGGKIKKVAPGKAAGYHGKDDPGQDMHGMMDRGDTKGLPRKKKIRSMR